MQSVIVALKELVDHGRDTRSAISSALYALMGPAVVLIVLLARNPTPPASSGRQPWATMAAVFALIAAFTSVSSVATDMIAGERERRSLLPLLSAAFSRGHVIVGKWLAASVFAVAGLLLNVLAFALLSTVLQTTAVPTTRSAFVMAPALLPLALLAAALGIFTSTLCRSVKESNTYLSMVTFAAMGVSMWLAFRPQTPQGWWSIVPILGHQRLLEWGFSAGASAFVEASIVGLQSAVLGMTTVVATGLVLAATCTLFRRDEAVYGG